MKRVIILAIFAGFIYPSETTQKQQQLVFRYSIENPNNKSDQSKSNIITLTHPSKYKWISSYLNSGEISPGISIIKVTYYEDRNNNRDHETTSNNSNNYTEIFETAIGQIKILAYDSQYTCFMVHEEYNQRVVVWRFNYQNKNAYEFADITQLINMDNLQQQQQIAIINNNANSSYGLATDCLALRIHNQIYHWNSQQVGLGRFYQKSKQQILIKVASGKNIIFDQTLKVAISDDNRIYAYEKQTNQYTLVNSPQSQKQLSVNIMNQHKQIYSQNDNINNLIIFDYQLIDQQFYIFKLLIIQLNRNNNNNGSKQMVYNLLHKQEGITVNVPQIQISQRFSKIVVSGKRVIDKKQDKDKSSYLLMVILDVNWKTKSVHKYEVPRQIIRSQAYAYVSISDQYLYMRNILETSTQSSSQNTYYQSNHYGYRFMSKSLIKLFDEPLNQVQNKTQKYSRSLIISTNNNNHKQQQQFIIIHQKIQQQNQQNEQTSKTIINLYRQKQPNLINLYTLNKQKVTPYRMTFSYPSELGMTYHSKESHNFQWFYSTIYTSTTNNDSTTTDETKFTVIFYKQQQQKQQLTNNNNKIVIQLKLKGNWSLLASSRQTQTCQIFYNEEDNLIEMYKFDINIGKDNDTNDYSVTHIENLTDYLKGPEHTDNNINLTEAFTQVNTDCTAFRINDFIYRKKQKQNTQSQKQQSQAEPLFTIDQSTINWNSNNTQFDSSFKAAINNQSLYIYNGSDYVKTLRSSFKDFHHIYINTQQTKIIVFTYEEQFKDQIWKTAIRYFMKNNSNMQWVEKHIHLEFTVFEEIQIIEFSPDFSIVGMGFVDETGQTIVQIKYIDQVTGEVTSIAVPEIAAEQQEISRLRLSNNYVYIRKTIFGHGHSQAKSKQKNTVNKSNNYEQLVFKLDKQHMKLKLIYERRLQQNESQNWVKTLIQQSVNGNIAILSEYQQDNLVTLIRRNIGNEKLQKIISNIDTDQFLLSGLVVDQQQNDHTLVLFCPFGCKSCLSQYSCQKCNEGFTLDKKIQSCIKCPQFCKSCQKDISTETTNTQQQLQQLMQPYRCIECFQGYFKSSNNNNNTYFNNSNKCLKCNSECHSCDVSADNCTKCHISYYFDQQSKKCMSCSLNCNHCISQQQCLECRYGFTIFSNDTTNSCVECPKNCGKCDSNRIMNCVACMPSFQLVSTTMFSGYNGQNNQTTISQCIICPQNCHKCLNNKCTECKPGYRVIKSSGTCTEKCTFPCAECLHSHPDKCTSCMANYQLVSSDNQLQTQYDNACVPDISCNQNQTCHSCPLLYVLQGKMCYECQISQQVNPHCINCRFDNLTECSQCKSGFYLSEELKICKKCSQQCQICLSETLCKKCKSGYVQSQRKANINNNNNMMIQPYSQQYQQYHKCTKCAPPCNTCSQSSTNCLSCIKHYSLSGWKCIKSTRIQLNLTLNADYSKITTSQLISIEKTIKTYAHKQFSDNSFTWNRLLEGSVIIEASVSSQSKQQSKQIMNSFLMGLGAGNSIEGFGIIACAFTSVHQDIDQGFIAVVSYTTHIVSFIVSLLIVVIIILLVQYRQRAKTSQRQQKQQTVGHNNHKHGWTNQVVSIELQEWNVEGGLIKEEKERKHSSQAMLN